MAIARFKIISPRPGWTGEGAGQLYFRNGVAELAVDLDNWEPGGKRGALSYYAIQGFGIEPLDGVSVEQAMVHPSQEAAALLAERDELQRQIDAIDARQDVDKLRKQLADKRAELARADAAARKGDERPADQGKQESVNAPSSQPFRTDVLPPSPDAPVADWRAYAVEVDPSVTDADVKSVSKGDLQARYGSVYSAGTAQEGTATA